MAILHQGRRGFAHKFFTRSAALLICAALWQTDAYASQHSIIVFGAETNSPQWNQQLHVTEAREGCSSAPEACVRFASEKLAQAYKITVAMSIPLDERTDLNASRYSALSLTNPFLVEVGIDDFLGQYRRFASSHGEGPAGKMLDAVIAGVKSSNTALGFGITVYENELTALAAPGGVPAASRNGIDYVHLYLHYRASGPAFAKYAEEARRLFPNAKIIAGSYPYDRRSYVPCAQSGKEPCSRTEEMTLFRQAITTQINLLKHGTVAGIEFSPGYFGKEDDWSGWQNPRICAPEGIRDCIALTKAMHEETRKSLSEILP